MARQQHRTVTGHPGCRPTRKSSRDPWLATEWAALCPPQQRDWLKWCPHVSSSQRWCQGWKETLDRGWGQGQDRDGHKCFRESQRWPTCPSPWGWTRAACSGQAQQGRGPGGGGADSLPARKAPDSAWATPSPCHQALSEPVQETQWRLFCEPGPGPWARLGQGRVFRCPNVWRGSAWHASGPTPACDRSSPAAGREGRAGEGRERQRPAWCSHRAPRPWP